MRRTAVAGAPSQMYQGTSSSVATLEVALVAYTKLENTTGTDTRCIANSHTNSQLQKRDQVAKDQSTTTRTSKSKRQHTECITNA